jgi:predicted transcriptional regulator
MYIEDGQMARLHRTQIYLPSDLSAALDRLAQRRRTSRAALLRQAALDFLEREGPHDEDPIFGVIGLGDAGPGAVSEEHDRFLVDLRAKQTNQSGQSS